MEVCWAWANALNAGRHPRSNQPYPAKLGPWLVVSGRFAQDRWAIVVLDREHQRPVHKDASGISVVDPW